MLIRTGFSRRWPDAARYLGTAERGAAAVAKLHFPGLHPDTARWLVANRSIRAIGIDTASIDYGQSTAFESHRTLFANGIPAFENLDALERLPLRGASIVALPMKIGGGSGGPLRAVAILPGPARRHAPSALSVDSLRTARPCSRTRSRSSNWIAIRMYDVVATANSRCASVIVGVIQKAEEPPDVQRDAGRDDTVLA